MIPVTFDTVATLQFGSEGHPTSLHFAIPEEWKTCKIRLHLRRSDGSFVPPMQLDENGCVKVNRSDSGKTGGQWMLSAESPDGKVSYSRIGKYGDPHGGDTMKILDETGAVVENPDLTLGYLVDDTEPVEHPAVEGVEEVSHYETVAEYPTAAGMCGRSSMCRACLRRPHGLNRCRCERYIRYTAEELVAREEERKKAEAREKLPETVAALQEDNKTLKERKQDV